MATRCGSRIIGFGDDVALGDPYLCFYDLQKKQKIEKNILKCYSQMTTWVSSELSYTQDSMFIGGTRQTEAAIFSISTKNDLQIKGLKVFEKMNLKTISCIKRIDGTDLLLAGAFQTILLLEPKEDCRKIDLRSSIIWSNTCDIKQIIMHPKYIITLGDDKREVVTGNINSRLDFEGLVKNEQFWLYAEKSCLELSGLVE